MKILYDHQIFTSQVFGGISRYFYELMNCYAREKMVEFELALSLSNNSYLQGASFTNVRTFSPSRRFLGRTTIITALNYWKSRRSLMKKDYDVFHPTNYDPYFLPLLGKKPFVLTVYDMIHEIYPDIFPSDDKTRESKKLLVEKAARIIAISENTKKDLMRIYGVDEDKITVIYLAGSIKPQNSIFNGIVLPEKYLFFVGERRNYKNFKLMVHALASMFSEEADLGLVCAGGGRFSAEEVALLEKAGIAGRTYQFSVNDTLLAHLYQRAEAFIFPSLYEGFGIPILEAFACGCPLIASRSSSLPEVAGDAAVYFNPQDGTSLRDAVSTVIHDQHLREEIRARGFCQAKNFTWDKTAQETKAVYESALK